MSKRTREKKSAKPQQPAKPDEISVGRRFAQPYAKARLLFDHAHSYREWNIVGQYDVPGFFYLESRFRLNPGEQPAIYTAFELCLHECQFERLQVRLGLIRVIDPTPASAASAFANFQIRKFSATMAFRAFLFLLWDRPSRYWRGCRTQTNSSCSSAWVKT